MKTGVIDVGGGLRGAYGAGVFDWCMDNDVRFDFCAGVSAGSANLASYLAGQRGRNYVFYTEYNLRRETLSMRNLLKTGNYLDLEYVYGTLSNRDGEFPLDFDAVMNNPAVFRIVATNARTGRPQYFDKSDMRQDDYGAIKASSCVPAVNRPYNVAGAKYYDGGISDPVPLKYCFDAGCDKVVVVLTRPKDYKRSDTKDAAISAALAGSYPKTARAMRRRAKVYNKELALARHYEKEGKVLIIAPDDIAGMKTLTKDKGAIDTLYHKGYRDAEKIRDFMISA